MMFFWWALMQFEREHLPLCTSSRFVVLNMYIRKSIANGTFSYIGRTSEVGFRLIFWTATTLNVREKFITLLVIFAVGQIYRISRTFFTICLNPLGKSHANTTSPTMRRILEIIPIFAAFSSKSFICNVVTNGSKRSLLILFIGSNGNFDYFEIFGIFFKPWQPFYVNVKIKIGQMTKKLVCLSCSVLAKIPSIQIRKKNKKFLKRKFRFFWWPK